MMRKLGGRYFTPWYLSRHKRFLGDIGVRRATAWKLYFLDRFPTSEIAAVMGVHKGTVLQLIHRATDALERARRRALRARLNNHARYDTRLSRLAASYLAECCGVFRSAGPSQPLGGGVDDCLS